MKRASKKASAKNNWMDTYADMVTLLLCFFVLLYSISTTSEEKWAALVRSLNPDADSMAQESVDGDIDTTGVEEQDQIDAQFEVLYEDLMNMSADISQEANLQIELGEDEIYITYSDRVFFAPDSHVLLSQGIQALDSLNVVLSSSSNAIEEIQIMGHTAPTGNGNIYADRTLAAMRAGVVTAYIEESGAIVGSKLISMGFGSTRPIASSETEETNLENRRVEFRITSIQLEPEAVENAQQ